MLDALHQKPIKLSDTTQKIDHPSELERWVTQTLDVCNLKHTSLDIRNSAGKISLCQIQILCLEISWNTWNPFPPLPFNHPGCIPVPMRLQQGRYKIQALIRFTSCLKTGKSWWLSPYCYNPEKNMDTQNDGPWKMYLLFKYGPCLVFMTNFWGVMEEILRTSWGWSFIPMIYQVFYFYLHPKWLAGFLPSTISWNIQEYPKHSPELETPSHL